MSKRKRQRGSATTRPEVAPVAQLRLDGGAEAGVPVEVPVVTLQPGLDAEESEALERPLGSAVVAPPEPAAVAPREAIAPEAVAPREAIAPEPAPAVAPIEPAVAPIEPAPVASRPPVPVGPPLGDFLTPPSGDLPLMPEAASSPSGDFPTITDPPRDSTPVRGRLRRFATPLPIARAATTPPVPPRVPPPIRPPPSPIELAPGTEITGELLRQLREQRGITLKEIEEVTRVRAISLAAVEAERYDELPAVKIYIRGFVQALARTIGVDAELASASYLARWDRWRERTPAPKRHFIK